jgi:hypothetical protein
VGTARYDAFFVPFGAGRRKNTAADERPAGLIIVLCLRLDDQNIEVRPPCQKARRRGDAGCAAPYDHDIMRLAACLRRFVGHGLLPFAWFMRSL